MLDQTEALKNLTPLDGNKVVGVGFWWEQDGRYIVLFLTLGTAH